MMKNHSGRGLPLGPCAGSIWPAIFFFAADEGVTDPKRARRVPRSGPRRGITGHQGAHDQNGFLI